MGLHFLDLLRVWFLELHKYSLIKHLLIEDHILAFNDFPILVSPKMITNLNVAITNKETFLRFRIKFTYSSSINMNIRKTTKHFKKRKVYLFATLKLFKYSAIQSN